MVRHIISIQIKIMKMKSVIPVLGILFVTCFIACKKDASVKNDPSIEASKTNAIKKGEPVQFELIQTSASGSTNWTVNPSENTQINSSGNNASVLFGTKGSYTITAVNGAETATTIVSVSDSVYTGDVTPIPSTILPLAEDEVIKIAVSRIDTNSIAGLLFLVQTANSYTCLSNSLISETITGANGYTIKYTGVNVPGGCTTGSAKAAGFNFLYPISNGTISLSIELNGTTYSGTITKTAEGFSIDWPYTNGIIISPTSL
jgi:hypothetical protein